jgi:phage baseplate assembly protein W
MLNNSFLGKGVSLSFDIANDGAIRLSSLQELVKESIFIILSTKIGERVMNYNFGCEIHELMFEINNTSTQARARMYVNDAIVKWEPRVEIKSVEVEALGKNELIIDVSYYIRETSVVDNLVYPFYLMEAN